MMRSSSFNVHLWLLWLIAGAVSGAMAGELIDTFGQAGGLLIGVPAGILQWLVLRRYVPMSPLWVLVTAGCGMIGFATAPGFGAELFWLSTFLFSLPESALAALSRAPVITDPYLVSLLGITFYHLCAGVGGGASGAIIGRLQRLVLRRTLRHGPEWLLPTILAAALASACAGLDLFNIADARTAQLFLGTSVTDVPTLFPDATVAGVAFGVIYAAITGIALGEWLGYRAVAA